MTAAEILGLASQYGIGGVFAILWWLERDERKTEQAANKVMFERTLTALVEHKSTVDTMNKIFAGKPDLR